MDITMSTFLREIKTLLPTNYRVYTTELEKHALVLLERLHKLGIVHGDAHSSNFMFNFSDSGKREFTALFQKQKRLRYLICTSELQRLSSKK